MLDLLVVIPCYNEEDILGNSTEKVYNFCAENLSKYNWKIVIGDNASTDRTPEIGKKLSEKFKEVDYFYLPQKGRGLALRKIWEKYDSKIYMYTDADLSTSISHILDIVNGIEGGEYDIVIGSRLQKNSIVRNRTIFREFTSRIYNKIIRWVFKTNFKDGQCGFKGISREIREKVVPMVKDNYWFFDTELLVISKNLKYKILEIPVHWTDRDSKMSKVKVFKDTIYFLKEIKRLKRELKGDKKIALKK